jgi:hypothetical protein
MRTSTTKHHGGEEGGGRKEQEAPEHLSEIEGDRYDNNKNVPPEFRLRENKSYKSLIANKHVEKRPKWSATCTTCTRWWTNGKCYKDCNNIESHVSSDNLPADKKAAFLEYLEICRRG